jgi:hypothetical protein
MRQNGRYEVVHLADGIVIVVDTRDGDFWVKHIAPSVSTGEARIRHFTNVSRKMSLDQRKEVSPNQ